MLAALSGLMLLAESRVSAIALAVAGAVAGLLVLSVHPVPGVFIAYGRYTATQLGQSQIIYSGEGWNASVAVSERSNGVRNYHNAGKVQASSEPQDMRLQRMLGHLTTLVPESAKTVVVIGCGAGVTAGAVSIDPVVAARNDRRDRTARPARGLHVFRRTQLRRRAQSRRSKSTSTMRGTFCSRRPRSSMRSPRIRSTRG